MRLGLRFTSWPLEDLCCDTIIAFTFKDFLKERSGIFELDEKTGAALTQLHEKGFLTGDAGETLLVPCQKYLRAEKILLKGLGGFGQCGLSAFREQIREVAGAVERMHVKDFAVQMPLLVVSEAEYFLGVEITCRDLVESFFKHHGSDDGFLLNMVISLNEIFSTNLECTIDKLKAHFNSRFDYTIIFDRTDNFRQKI